METLSPTRHEDLLKFAIDILNELTAYGVGGDHGYLFQDKYFKGIEKPSNPPKPGNGQFVIWMSDGTVGTEGNVYIASTIGGNTKYAVLFNYAGGTDW